MALQIPTVTIDDLRAFHAKHFPHAPAPEYILHGVEPEPEAVEEYYEEDDGLGYYPDGSKRTLTDEQIAMFRHSEIHAILRKRRLRRENGEVSEDDNKTSTQKAPSDATNGADKGPLGATEEPKKQQWATTSAKTKAKTKRKRDKYKPRRKERQKERGLPPRKKGRNGGNQDGDEDEDEESDEWDPWHQANGPDNQKDEALDLDY